MIDIVIPYLHQEAIWNELIFSIRSIEKYFKGIGNIILVGDAHPAMNIKNLPVYQVKKKQYAKAWDSILKMEAIVNNTNISEDFVYWYDDIVLLKEIDKSFFDNSYCVHDMALVKRCEHNNYGEVKWHTYDVLTRMKLSTYSYETHTPKIFNKEKMKVILNKFCEHDKKLLLNSLYGNYFLKEKPIELRPDDCIKAGFYGNDDVYSFGNKSNYNEVAKNKTFINYNNKGLTEGLKKYIISRFKSKCTYEK